ncbi:CotH kinase family protein [Elizabethkingia anophelis]|nr:CotH kinase family protein [Elizabethkingia anophelis]
MSSENNLLPFVKPIPVDKIPINNNPSAASTLIFADEQLNPRRVSIQYFNEKIASGVTGTIKTQQTLPELNALPDGIYRASTFGTYANGFTVAKGVLTLFKKVGIVWTVDTEILMPNSTTPTWEPKGFDVASQVLYGDNLYEANVNTLASDIPGESAKWDTKIIGFSNGQKENLIEVVDKDGNLLGYWDGDGKFSADYKSESIPQGAVKGLSTDIDNLKEVSNQKDDSENLVVFLDKEGNIFGHADKDGVWNFPKLKTESFNTGDEVEEPSKIFQGRFLYLPAMEFFRVDVTGPLPTDAGVDRTPTFVELSISDRQGNELVRLKGKMSIQGQGSATYPKKGYAIDLLNDEGKSVDLKMGDWFTTDGFHWKAFHTDITHTRDVGCGRLWLQMAHERAYPANFIKSIPTGIPATGSYNSKTFFTDSASFITNGIPFEMHSNDNFQGLFTWRIKKSVGNYAIDNSNQNHLLTDSIQLGAFLGSKAYADYNEITSYHELKSPKTPSAATKANVVRFFKFWNDVYNDNTGTGGTSPYLAANHQNYIILESWIDFLIESELIWHWDSMGNNTVLASYDGGLTWQRMLNDTDNTIGLYVENIINPADTFVMTGDIWPKFKATFLQLIKERYTKLRNSGVLSMINYFNIFGGISKQIPVSVYSADFAKWGCVSQNGIPNMAQLYSFLKARQDYLDTQWKLN